MFGFFCALFVSDAIEEQPWPRRAVVTAADFKNDLRVIGFIFVIPFGRFKKPLTWDFPYNIVYLSPATPLSIFSNRISN
jgi:hypothetical protein